MELESEERFWRMLLVRLGNQAMGRRLPVVVAAGAGLLLLLRRRRRRFLVSSPASWQWRGVPAAAGVAFTAVSRPFAWILLGAVAPLGAVVLPLADIRRCGAPHCVAVEACPAAGVF